MGKTIKTQFYSDYCIVNNTVKIVISDLYNYYVTENHRYTDTCKYFNIKTGMLTTIMNHYNLSKPKSLSHIWNKITCKERYNDENYNNTQKNKLTCLARYGVDNQFKRSNFIIDSHIKAFGTVSPIQNSIYNKKIKDKWENKSLEELQKIQRKTWRYLYAITWSKNSYAKSVCSQEKRISSW